MVAAAVLTANHYIVDAVAGAGLSLLSWWAFVAGFKDRPRGYAGWDGLRIRQDLRWTDG